MKKKIFYVTLVLVSLILQQSVYLMTTYRLSVFYKSFSYLFIVSLLIYTLYSIFNTNEIKQKKNLILSIVLRIFEVISIKEIISTILVINLKNKKKIYIIFYKVLSYICFIGLIFYFCNLFNINLDLEKIESDHLLKKEENIFYLKSYLIVFSNNTMNRFQSFFDEPGVLGTMIGMLFLFDNESKKLKWERIILIISGFLTFSTAFYVLCMLNIVFLLKIKHKIKIFLLSIFILYQAENIIKENMPVVYSRTYNKVLNITKNNRESSEAKEKLNDFFKTSEVFLGKRRSFTKDFPDVDISSWRLIVYKNGILGFLTYLLYLLRITNFFKRKRNVKIIILIFMTSIYQRPAIITLANMIILVCGLENFENNLKNKSI